MWIAPGGKRFRYYTLVIMLIISLFQIWAPGDYKAGAIRLFPPLPSPDNNIHEATMKVVTTTTSTTIVDQKTNNSKLQDQQHQQKEDGKDEDLFHKYFNGSQLQNITSSTNEGVEDSKRRVPSCPDPLHNK